MEHATALALDRRADAAERHERQLLCLREAADGHGLRNARRADDGAHLLRVDQRVGLGDGRVGAGAVVLEHDLERPAVDAAARIDHLLRQQHAFAFGQPDSREAAGGREQGADADRFAGRCALREAGRGRRRQREGQQRGPQWMA
ncbi:hypothetical protein D3C72_1814750 [compost metagenome]